MLIQANGLIDGPKDVEAFLLRFIPWVESQGWSYGGSTVMVDNMGEPLPYATSAGNATNVYPGNYP